MALTLRCSGALRAGDAAGRMVGRNRVRGDHGGGDHVAGDQRRDEGRDGSGQQNHRNITKAASIAPRDEKRKTEGPTIYMGEASHPHWMVESRHC